MVSVKDLYDISNVLRRDVLKMTSAAGSGHPTSCLSSAELMSVLFFHEMNYDTADSGNPDNDEFILSKGHAAPILYACLKRAGCMNEDLMNLRKLDSLLQGHPMPELDCVKIASGSLGQGAAVGVGMALAGKLQKRKFRTYVLMGDSESAEGSVWEAVELAAHYELKNLCLIIDVNRLGQRGETMLGHKTKSYKERFESFGWQAEIIDGYDVVEIRKAFLKAKKSNKPVAIIAKTFKGEGVSFLKDKNGWHGKTLDEEELKKALKEIPDPEMPKIEIRKPGEIKFKDLKVSKYKIKNYKKGEMVATREAYGSALSGLALADSKVIAVDAEVSNSTFSAEIKNVKPAQFVEAFIAEQAMVGIVLGLSKKGFDVFGSTFSAFLSRAHDQIRMSALSNGKFTLCGSHCGTSIGEDGASQMGLEDISMMRALPNSIVFYPSDAVSTEKLVCLSSKLNGIKYIRTTRPKTKVIYKNSERFEVGDFKILKQGKKDKIVLVGSGITLHETLKAHEKIKDSAVVDLYCVKPFNSEKFIEFVKNHGGKVVVAEDNYAEGGIGEMLSSVLVGSGIKMKSLAVREIPHSGKGNELLEKYGIDLRAIIGTAKKII